MGRMTRTQVSFDEAQYRFLKREAAERDMSLAAYLRELVDGAMVEREVGESDIMELAGIFEGEALTNEEIDEILVTEGLRGSRLEREVPADGSSGGRERDEDAEIR